MKKFLFFTVYIFVIITFVQLGYTEEQKLSKDSQKMVDALAVLASMNPGIAMDTPSAMFGQYSCLHLTKGLTNMIHIAYEPAKDDSDIIMLVHADPLITQGLRVDEFKQLTKPPYGPNLTAGQWYYIPELKLLALPVRIEDVGFGKQ